MKHSKFEEIYTLVEANIPVLLTGEKGSGKTTIAQQVADELGWGFYSLSMTRQTTLSHIMGFVNVNGDYVPSQMRKAAEGGGLMLLDEMDAADANVLLTLNTIENGFLSFPDGIVRLHENFRLAATANPQDQHQHYVGRNKLDAATLDRFDIVDIDRDSNLEKTLVDNDTYQHINMMRKELKNVNSSQVVSMRDSLRYQKRKELRMLDGFMMKLCDNNHLVYEAYEKAIKHLPKFSDQSECKTTKDLYELIYQQAQNPV